MPELRIDVTFREHIPPLKEDELQLLENSIIFEGCRDPIIVWNNIIIDGHHRYDICKKNNIPFNTVEMDFNSKNEALKWMIDNQLGRRNLNDAQRIELALKREQIIGGTFTTSPLTREKRKEIAEELDVSESNVSKVKNVLEKAPGEVQEQMRKGDISINKAEKTTKPRPKEVRTNIGTEPQKPEILDDERVCPTCKGTGKLKIKKMDISEDVWVCPDCGRKHELSLDVNSNLKSCKNCGSPRV